MNDTAPHSIPGEDLFYRVGNRDFYWDSDEMVEHCEKARLTHAPRHSVAIAEAREHSARTGLPIVLMGRRRINDYVGPAHWQYRTFPREVR